METSKIFIIIMFALLSVIFSFQALSQANSLSTENIVSYTITPSPADTVPGGQGDEVRVNMIPEGPSLAASDSDNGQVAGVLVNMVPEGTPMSPAGAGTAGTPEEGAGPDIAQEDSPGAPAEAQSFSEAYPATTPEVAISFRNIAQIPGNRIILYGFAALVIIITVISLIVVGKSEGWWRRRTR